MQLLLEENDVTIRNINIRREKHGDSRVAAYDLNCKVETTPEVLDQIAGQDGSSFKDMLYDKEGKLKAQTLEELKFNTEFEGHVVILNHSNVNEENQKIFDDAKVCKFVADPKSGHMVDLYFQIQLHPSAEQSHWLVDGLERDMWLLEIKGAKQAEMDFDDDPDAGDKKEAA